jgi:D-alanyl-D-alanine carboxypeptidase/D-alanyl-D-alanine-endopeptidase (penicillin-binding protein 4)
MNNQVVHILLQDTVLATGQIGISIYEPATNTYWYNYNADKYFVPASNVKLFTCYAAMKHVGDSVTGLWYQNISDTAINIIPSGDPTLLHPAFAKQPVLQFLQQHKKAMYVLSKYNNEALGKGWSWDDYNDAFMAERNTLPIYGNVVNVELKGFKSKYQYAAVPIFKVTPMYFKNNIDSVLVLPNTQLKYQIKDTNKYDKNVSYFNVVRAKDANRFMLTYNDEEKPFTNTQIPFCVQGNATTINILKNDFDINIQQGQLVDNGLYPSIPPHLQWHAIKTQPTDAILQHMMYTSDNFMAEQVLVMLQQQSIWQMQPQINTEAVINAIIKNNLQDVPQQPIWVDGCGLSRYNLFTPQSFVYIINKMNNEFGIDRVKNILTTSGQGTLKNYYTNDSTFIYAKTGTLSGVVALSGFVITKKSKLLIFSILTNNFVGKAKLARRAIEKFITALIQNN